ncbi:28S ribosomal protein S23, mitochondrial-like [Nematostella vectensis]|uniref:28S ribosomal protein S23, mitochondrial-like n=1 Tax=Nematostella vectensis TaxID=45351 RepID=UPI0020774C9A|nr:28S ribosomal protein S23, mitochondrial-like [Nematostella vectensis]
MTGSRHLRGTVLSRVRNLLRSGALTRKPVWYEVVEAFPPIVETKINRRAESGRVAKIEYPEDFFRRNFYKTYRTNALLDIRENVTHEPQESDRFVEKCQNLVGQGLSREEALEEVSLLFAKGQLALNDAEENEADTSTEDKPSIGNIYDLLKEKVIPAKTPDRQDNGN